MNSAFECISNPSREIRAIRFSGPPPSGRDNLPELLHLMGAEVRNIGPAARNVPITWRRLHEGEPLFHEGSIADAIHFVRAGTFKIYRTTEDGYEQVLAFANRSEVLGYDAVHTGRHPASCVALEESSVYAMPTRDMFLLGENLPSLDRAIRLAISSQLHRRGELADLMSAVAAEVRLSRFILQMSARMAALGQSPRQLVLKMSRRDIASYLGVAHETVSRSFSWLAREGYLAVKNRELELTDMAGLQACARGSRKPSGEPAPTHLKPIAFEPVLPYGQMATVLRTATAL